MVVDVDLDVLEGRELIASRRKGLQRRAVELLEQLGSRAVHLLERFGVDHADALADRHVRLSERGEVAMAQLGDDPTFCEQHAGLDLGLVSWLVGARRDDRDAIVGGHLLIGGVHVGLVTVRPGDARAEVVTDHDLVTTAHRLEGVHVGRHPVQQLLGGKCLGEQIARRTSHCDEQLGVTNDITGSPVIDRDLHAGEVDEELLAGAMHLAHDDVDVALEDPVVVDELGVAIAVGMGFAVFEPQQLERHPFSTKLPMDIGKVWHRPGDAARRRRREQQPFEVGIRELLGQGPRQPGRVGASDVITDGGEGEIE